MSLQFATLNPCEPLFPDSLDLHDFQPDQFSASILMMNLLNKRLLQLLHVNPGDSFPL